MTESACAEINSQPAGLCLCGCGQSTRVAEGLDRTRGLVKGQALRYIHGHNGARERHGDNRKGKRTAEYSIWCAMRRRCSDPKNNRFQYYGGRGIAVCERWGIFENFLQDMGRRPGPDYSIERVDNGLGYQKENCKWATRTEQCRNKRSTKLNTEAVKVIRFMTERGITHACLAGLHGVAEGTVSNIHCGKTWLD